MSEYKPNDEVLKKIAESIPKDIKTQLKLDELVFKDCPNYGIVLKKEDRNMNVNVMLENQEHVPAGAMIHAAICLLGGAKKALGISTDDISCFVYSDIFAYFLAKKFKYNLVIIRQKKGGW